MRESRWRSMSIMDLNLTRRRSSSKSAANPSALFPDQNSGNGGQSYELIKSTQSLVDRLHLNAEDIAIQPVHPSIIGQDTWFQITYTSSGTTRYFSCQNSKERDEWIASLKKTLMLTEDRRRTDNSLKVGVLEVKGLSDKKKYYVEILVDDKLYARTSSKKMNGMCFWGEHFEFKDLPHTERISLLIHKDKGLRKKPKKPVGKVRLSVPSIQSRYMQEKWHLVEKSSRRESPSIRLKCQFQSIDILPLRDYEDFLYFLKDEYKFLCKMFEPNISVKVKEELSFSLMSVFHSEDIAEDVLAEIVVDEISSLENEHLTFRGNSIATKAMESYIKLVGQRYLHSTLHSVVTEIILSEVDLEVDSVKVGNPESLATHRANLTTVVKQVWSRIAKSYSYFPIQLQRCFYKIKQFLEHVGKPDIADNLISSCIFLRYLCPAILSPSLFNLTDEYPSEKANRNLTLIAKTLQTLANFTRYEGKENSMEFLNSFLEEESVPMRNFLRQISSPLAEDGWIPNLSSPPEKTDLGRHLSCLHTILLENISKIPCDNPKAQRLRDLLDDINQILKRPTIAGLEQISQSTMDTLKQMQSEKDGGGSLCGANNNKSASSSILPWSWTLPKKSKNLSHPAPHHEAPRVNFFAKQEPSLSISSDPSTSPSTSLTPSPGSASWCTSTKEKINKKHAITDLPTRKPKSYPSSVSLNDSETSDDSTYSSQYPSSDATSTPKINSHTLPRPLTGGVHGYASRSKHQSVQRQGSVSHLSNINKSLSDYEQEITDLRNAMKNLQVKLGEAERKLSEKPGEALDDGEDKIREVMKRLSNEEDKFRRDQLQLDSDLTDKEMMILMQQKKIASLDEANAKLLRELNRLGDKLTSNSNCREVFRDEMDQNSQETSPTTPKTVDELIDSLHSTPI